ncbi:Uncharacterised protein [uncultured Clostridium sp.]|nr:Uncharacterised protein [uncultured Clostridium sp.]SCJ46460.1 Uncharacterised protein [uncultured Clostridium sp.]
MGVKLTEQQKINDLIFLERKNETNFLDINNLNENEFKNFRCDDRYVLTAFNQFLRDSSPFDPPCDYSNVDESISVIHEYISKEDIKISFFDKIKLLMGADEEEVYHSYGYIKDTQGYYFIKNHTDNCIKEDFKSYSAYEDGNDYNNFYDSEPYKKAELPEFDPVITSHYDGFGNTVWTDGIIESNNPYDDNFK